MTAIESLAVAALRRWSHERAQLRTTKAKREGYTPRRSRDGDARQVRVIDFERAFSVLTPQQRIPLLLVYRDQLPLSHVGDILHCSPQLAAFHAAEALARLTYVLDRLHLL